MGVEVKIEVTDKTDKCLNEMTNSVISWLEEAKDLVSSQASLNSPVDTGALSRSFLTDSFVDTAEKVAYVGSSLEYAIWQEFGTGEYALNGNGRKGGWCYIGTDGQKHFTHGVHPQRMLYSAVNSCQSLISAKLQEILSR